MQTGLEILRWSFWSPETREPSQWPASQLGGPHPPSAVPDHSIPALHRRRMSSLSKMAVQTALEATEGERPDFLVFCSQHGELKRTSDLLAAIVARGELSPTSFSQSVHNASAGLFTIITTSQAPATSLAAGPGTFAYGWIEAQAFLASHPGRRVLLVGYDEPLPPEYRAYSAHQQHAYAVALLLGAASSGGFWLEQAPPGAEEPAPLAPLFMAWALTEEATLSRTAGDQGWIWRRLGA
jgi:hypothetical protein